MSAMILQESPSLIIKLFRRGREQLFNKIFQLILRLLGHLSKKSPSSSAYSMILFAVLQTGMTNGWNLTGGIHTLPCHLIQEVQFSLTMHLVPQISSPELQQGLHQCCPVAQGRKEESPWGCGDMTGNPCKFTQLHNKTDLEQMTLAPFASIGTMHQMRKRHLKSQQKGTLCKVNATVRQTGLPYPVGNEVLNDGEEAKDDPIGEPLCVVNLGRALKCLDGAVGWVEEAHSVGQQLKEHFENVLNIIFSRDELSEAICAVIFLPLFGSLSNRFRNNDTYNQCDKWAGFNSFDFFPWVQTFYSCRHCNVGF